MDGVTNDTAENAHHFIRTMWVYSAAGPVAFSQWGQNSARQVAAIQLDKNYNDRVIYPLASVKTQISYPMPTFSERRSKISYMSDSLDIAFTVVAAVGIAISIILAAFVIKFRDRKILLAASPLFLLLILGGTVLMYLTIFSWVLEAHTVACHMRYWLLGMGFVVCFAALFAKTFRVIRIFGSKSLTVFRISNGQLMIGWTALVLVEAILLAIWSATANPVSYTFIVDPERPSKDEWRCQFRTASNRSASKVLMALLLAFNFALAFAAVWVSYRAWSIKAKLYNESRAIGFAMYNMICFGILGTALQLSNVLQPRSMFVVRSCFIILSTFVTVVVLFSPKVLHLIRTKGADFSPSTIKKTGTTTTSSSGGDRSMEKGTKLARTNYGGGSSPNINAVNSVASDTSDGSEDVLFWRGKYSDAATKLKKLKKANRELEKELAIYRESNF